MQLIPSPACRGKLSELYFNIYRGSVLKYFLFKEAILSNKFSFLPYIMRHPFSYFINKKNMEALIIGLVIAFCGISYLVFKLYIKKKSSDKYRDHYW